MSETSNGAHDSATASAAPPAPNDAFFRQFFESLGDRVAVLDREWRCVFANADTAQLLGRSLSHLPGACIWDLIPEAIGTDFYHELQRAAAERVRVRGEHYCRFSDRWFENEVFPIGDYVALVSRDITADKKIAARLKEEQKRLRDLLDSINDAFMGISAESRITWMNALALEFLGAKSAEVIGKPISEVFPQCLGTAFDAAARKVWETKKPVRLQAIGPISGRWVDTSIYPGPGGVSVFSRDIHEQKMAEQALRESEERLRLALDAGAIGVWDWDIRGNAITWSPRTYELHGLRPGQFAGTLEAFARLVHPEDRERVQREIASAISAARPYQIELRVVHPDGSTHWLTTSAKVVSGPDGKPLRMIGATADISERKRSETELRRSQNVLAQHASVLEHEVSARTARLSQTIASLEGVAYTIAHDLRAPLRALNGFAQIVREDYGPCLDETGRKYLVSIASSAARMDNLISDLLSYAKLSHSELPLEIIDLDPALREVLLDLKGELLGRDAAIEIEQPLGSVHANRTVLIQVFSNLISNALKFVAPGVKPRVQVRAHRAGNRVRISFQDNGIGIKPEYHKQVFGLFERLHNEAQYPGTGIGLAIVRKALERIGGSVQIDSAPRAGACFIIDLPAAGELRKAGALATVMERN